MKNDYGQKSHYEDMGDMYLPGSPDARAHKNRDMYDKMPPITGVGNKVSTKKNKTGTGAHTTGIQGDATRGKSGTTQNKAKSISSKGKTHKADYGTSNGNQLDNSVGAHDDQDYGKGRNKAGSQRRYVREQGR